MLRLLQWLLIGHIHQWKEVDRGPIRGEVFDGSTGVTGIRVDCVCIACGKPKRFLMMNDV